MIAASSPTPSSVDAFFISIFAVSRSINPNSPSDDISVLVSLILSCYLYDTTGSHFGMPVIYHQHKFVMDLPIRGNDMRLIRRIGTAGEVRDPSARFLDDQKPRRAVPCIQLMFIKPVKTSRRHPAKVHCCRSQPPDRHPRADQPGEYLQRTVWLVQVGVWKTRDQTG